MRCFRSMNARSPTPMSVPPPPYNSTCVAEKTFLTSCTAASQHATTTSAPYPSWRVRPRQFGDALSPAASLPSSWTCRSEIPAAAAAGGSWA